MKFRPFAAAAIAFAALTSAPARAAEAGGTWHAQTLGQAMNWRGLAMVKRSKWKDLFRSRLPRPPIVAIE